MQKFTPCIPISA